MPRKTWEWSAAERAPRPAEGERVAKVLYSVSMSLDGYIAGPGGDMSWLTDHLGPNSLVDELIPQIGALLVGNRTFRGDDPHRGTDKEGKAFGGGWSGPQFVLTHRPPAQHTDGVTFVDDFDEAVAAARNAAGDKYVNVIGADVGRQCLQAGVVDEVLTMVVPVLLGDGVRLFDVAGGAQIQLERLDVTVAPGATSLWFRVSSPANPRVGPPARSRRAGAAGGAAVRNA
jgi:dihydrofolate reductase